MRPYIYTKRNSIHIVDIRETVKGLLRAKRLVSMLVAKGGEILFVGTKRQAKDSVVQWATSSGMPYVCERWLGGTLTNFRTIRLRLTRLAELETVESEGRMHEYSKKQQSRLTRERKKIHRNLSGIREMTRLPTGLVVIDVQREHLAVREARAMNIPTICLIDTDSDPDFADIPIPGNDDAMRAIEVVLSELAAAIQEGKRARTSEPAEPAGDGPRRRSRRETTARADGAGDTSGTADAVEAGSNVGTGRLTAEPAVGES